MGDVLAVVSKAVFERQAPEGLALDGVWPLDRYVSKNPGLSSLSEGGERREGGRRGAAAWGDRRWVPKQLWKRKKIGFEEPKAFSPDGQHLLVMLDEGPDILDAATGKDV